MFLMFGREARLPLDLMFQEVGVEEDAIRNKDHQKFVEDWHGSMKEAMELARANMDKAADYNKRYRDKRAKIVEINVGDRVLVRNYREKGGTGKLKSFWEEAMFVVEEKKEGLPVYQVRNIRKRKDVRVVHRNKLMRCEELPLDVFDEPKEQKRKRGVRVPREEKLEKQHSSETSKEPDLEVEDDSEVEDVAVTVEGRTLRRNTDQTPQVVLDDTADVDSDDSAISGIEELVDSDLEETRVEEEEPNEDVEQSIGEDSTVAYDENVVGEDSTVAYDENVTGEDSTEAYDEGDGDSTLVEADNVVPEEENQLETTEISTEGPGPDETNVSYDMESPEPETRRSSRHRIPAKKFSYNVVGGNPIMKVVDRT